MLDVDLLTLADVLNGQLYHSDQADQCLICGVGIDARCITQGAAFFAFKGERVDGHDYIEQAKHSGAGVAVVERVDAAIQFPQIKVDNVKQALGDLAYWWRDQLKAKIIAVTGSNGKTTVKEMLFQIFSGVGETVATQGNLNNELGMPLTLLRVAKSTQYAVLEMGANHFGEIAYMSRIARPDIALVNNAGDAHLEGFGDVTGVAKAKGEIYDGLNINGTAVINLDDERADLWRSQCVNRPSVTFSLNTVADVCGVYNSNKNTLCIKHKNKEIITQLNLLGEHNVRNVLAASSVALAAGLTIEQVGSGICGIKPVQGRLYPILNTPALKIIDDTYNANPSSVKAGAKVLSELSLKQAWLILGDLAELGEQAVQTHTQLGEQLKEIGIDRLFTTGALTQNTAKAFGKKAQHYLNKTELIKNIIDLIKEHQTHNETLGILVKGSRSSRMESVIDALKAEFGA